MIHRSNYKVLLMGLAMMWHLGAQQAMCESPSSCTGGGFSLYAADLPDKKDSTRFLVGTRPNKGNREYFGARVTTESLTLSKMGEGDILKIGEDYVVVDDVSSERGAVYKRDPSNPTWTFNAVGQKRNFPKKFVCR
jgi:hypothetical protein